MPGSSLPLLLSTDMRLGATDYCNDHTWELDISRGEPPALNIQTTLGLRARSLRIFPRFSSGDLSITDPSEFANPVRINSFFPNLITMSFSPLPGINVEIEYWVPDPYVIAARTKVSNNSSKQRTMRLEWAVSLNPLPGGQRMMPADIGFSHILTGNTENIAPVFILSDGAHPTSGPFTSLALDLELSPKGTSHTKWVLASLGDMSSSYELAQQTLSHSWDAEFARIVRINSNLIEIYTGNPDWDLAFTLAQYRAFGLLFNATDKLSHPSYVATRLPDTGYSFRGDGSDYSHLWNGQTPLETYYLISLLLPTRPKIAQGLLLNFLASQTPEGFVDWKPGLAGQRSQILASPLLASLAWLIFQITEDKSFLEQIYPKLLAFLQHWFYSDYDRDADGIPEWDHHVQTGLEEHPLFSTWLDWTAGIDITSVESPDLCSFLYRESVILIEIAKLLQRTETIPALQAIADHLKLAVEAGWDENNGCYQYWDRESHISAQGELLGLHQGSGEFKIDRVFEQSHRLHLSIQSSNEATRRLQIFIHGSAPSGGHRVEKIVSENLRWHLGRCRVTSERIYSALEHIEFQGLAETDHVSISTVGLACHDITNLLPLWAGIPDQDRAKGLIKRMVTNRKTFWGRFGIRTCIENPSMSSEANQHCKNIYIPYNYLIGEGLLYYGQYSKAAELVTHLMKAVVNSMKKEGAFRRGYHSDTGHGSVDRNLLRSLPPMGLFLKVLGVNIINPRKVCLSGTNPFPWSVMIKYQGLTVIRQKQKTMVIFSDGQKMTLKNGKTQIVGLE